MKGWVYVISNRAMPELVKVGFSTKDPELRASELNHTGSPHPYLVEYELLIEAPYDVEQRVHKALHRMREAKEWFRCSPEEAVAAIKTVAGSTGLHEIYKRAQRAKADAIRNAQAEAIRAAEAKAIEHTKAADARAKALQDIKRRMEREELSIREYWDRSIEDRVPRRAYRLYMAVGATISCVLTAAAWFVTNGSPFFFGLGPSSLRYSKHFGDVVFWALLEVLMYGFIAYCGAFAGLALLANVRNNRKVLNWMGEQKDGQLAEVRAKTIKCPRCGSAIFFDREKVAGDAPNTQYSCSSCKTPITSPWA